MHTGEHTQFFSNQTRYTKYSREDTWDPVQEKELFKQVKSHTLPLVLYKVLPLETKGCSPLICLVKQKWCEACCLLEIAVLWESSHICQERLERPQYCRKPPAAEEFTACSSSTSIPPCRLILQEGQGQKREPGSQQKGKGKSRVGKTEKKKFARVVKNPAQKGQEGKRRVRNTRQTELFGWEEVSKILGHQGWGRMGKYEQAGERV